MNITYRADAKILYIAIEGRIDASNAAAAEEQIFAIKKSRFHSDLLAGATLENPVDATPIVQNPTFTGNSWTLWNVTGTFGNQRFNGAAETWHSTNFSMQQTLDVPSGYYTLTTQMANG